MPIWRMRKRPSTPTADGAQNVPRKILVWDAPVRIFHWLIVALVAAAYATWRLDWMGWHVLIGEAALALVFFRLLWGFLGSETARFASFLASPREAARHLLHSLRREPDRQIGHNPAGGWMVLLLLGLLLGETLTGIYVANDVADDGPLTELVPASVANLISALHSLFWDALLAAAALHVLAIIVYATIKRHDLVTPMITGRKTLSPSVSQPAIASYFHALVLLGCGVLAAVALAEFL
jgi:cytochrome b